jgi:hypothetical protein
MRKLTDANNVMQEGFAVQGLHLEVHNSHILLQWILIRADIVKNALYLPS